MTRQKLSSHHPGNLKTALLDAVMTGHYRPDNGSPDNRGSLARVHPAP